MSSIPKALTILFFLTPLAAMAQRERPLPPAQPRFKVEPRVPLNDFVFAPIKASSTRFSDQAGADDTALTRDEIFAARGVTMVVPSARSQDAGWEKAAKSLSTALERIGLVATGKADFNKFPSVLALELKSLLLSKRLVLVFRPKDQETFAFLAKGVELLGDQELGPLSYDLRGLALIIEGKVRVTEQGCQVALTISDRVYGNLISDGQPAQGTGDLIPAEWMDTHKLIESIKGAMPR